MTPEAKEMMKILENLQNAQTTTHDVQENVQPVQNNAQKSVSTVAPTNIREDAKEMYNILAKLENATTNATASVVETETPMPIGEKGDQSFGVGNFKIELEKKQVVGYNKTYYHILDESGNRVHSDIALFESAMAITKQMLFKNDSNKIRNVIELDMKYDEHLTEAARHKTKLKMITESARKDIIQAKHSDIVGKMSYIKKQIKRLL